MQTKLVIYYFMHGEGKNSSIGSDDRENCYREIFYVRYDIVGLI